MTPLLTLLPTLITLCLSSAPTLTAASPALIEQNLAYRSPYSTEPGLAIDTKAVHKRHVAARAEVQQVVEERKRKRSVHEDNGEVRAPEGEPAENPLIYGLGVAVWDHDWVFGGDVNFTHGVASGDPFDYSVILWTRVKPVEEGRIDIPICVTYDVYESEDATGQAVSSGYALTGPDVDYTVKITQITRIFGVRFGTPDLKGHAEKQVEATGLTASTKYSYVFANCAKPEQKSVVGKTRTAPGKHATNIETQRFAIYSCSNYPNGFFSAYSGPVIYGDADYAIHLGDYIYEYGSGGAGIGRVPSKNAELATLDDYRQRYAQYRTDEDLAMMHQNIPLIAIWDDHETANNDWKAGSSNSNDSLATGGCAYSNNTICFSDRAINAKRAYYEWIPIRSVDLADQGRIWRDFNFGDLLSIVALDTRKYDRDITDLSYNIDYVSELAQELDTERSIVGPKQEAWIEKTLSGAQDRGTKWKLLLNQVILGSIDHRWTSQVPEKATFITNYDAWDGYQANRRRLLSYIYDNQIDNVLAVTGDTHANWLFENSLETTYQDSNDSSTLRKLATTANAYQRGVVTEYGVTAVSSNGWGKSWGSYENSTVPAQRMVDGNPSLLYTEGYHRGYMTLNINYTHVQTVWYSYPGSFTARVSNHREEAMRVVQQVDMNQVQRPLAQPRYGKVKPGNF